MPRRIAGLASIFVDGIAFSFKGGLEYNPNNTKRTPIMAGDGTLAGYSEEGEAPYISVTLLDTGGFSVASLYNNTNIQIVAQLANGKTITGHSMTVMDPPAGKNDDATLETRFIGPSVVEG